jgi:hypothetical protein
MRISINKMNSGRMQICCARPSSNGYVLTYPAATAKVEVTKVLQALGITEQTIDKCLATLADFGPNEMLLVEERDVLEEGLQRNGFVAV